MYVFIQITVITKNVITNSNNIVDNMLKTFANNLIFTKVNASVKLDITYYVCMCPEIATAV